MAEEELLSVIVGEINAFDKEYKEFKKQNKIVKEFISSQMATLPNPQYVKGITSATQPEHVTTVIISAVLFYTKIKTLEKV